jgi:hypothetical protein
MSIYFTTNSDGNNTEGIGAMIQYQLICYALSKTFKTKHYFTGFKNLAHYQYFNTTQEQWSNDVTTFLNLPVSEPLDLPVVEYSTLTVAYQEFIKTNDNVIVNIDPHTLLNFANLHINKPQFQLILKQIGSDILFNDKLKYFDTTKSNIAIHIRKYTPTDCDPHPRRELFDESKKDYYINLINMLHNDNSILHVYSQGSDEDWEFLKRDNVVLHIEEHPLISLYHMINANVLVTANSSLSYIAHLLGNHELCFVRDTFFHQWKPNSIYI